MKRILVFCLLFMLLLQFPAAGSELAIGKLKITNGDVWVIRGTQAIPLKTGDKIFREDAVRTGANSSAGIIFEDNTILSLGSNSEIVVDEYMFVPEKGLFSMVARMVRGTAAYLSGIIGRQSPESVKFQTPDATIGIRGTQFLVKVDCCR